MATLTSVNKEHLDNILNRIKTIEWRKKPLPLGKHYGYETKNKGGCGKVTGEFEVVENIKFNLHGDTYRPQWLAKGCVPFEFLVKYANGAEYLYANIIESAKRYDKPKELREFRAECRNAYFQYGDCYCKDGYGSCAIRDREKEYPYNEECIYFDCPSCGGESCEYEDFAYCLCNGRKPITRPPQSYMGVEELKEN